MILFDIYKLEIENINSTVLMDKNLNYDKKTYLSFEFKGSEIPSFYTTDVITYEVDKSLNIETKNDSYKVIFGSDNGTSDTYIRKNNFIEITKKYKKSRADDFIQEVKIIDNFLKYKVNEKIIKNISCEKGLKVASICANIFENN